MASLAKLGSYDKGTITKSIKALEINGYLEVVASEEDKRQKILKTTEKCRQIIIELYNFKTNWLKYVMQDLDEYEQANFIDNLGKLLTRAQELDKDSDYEDVPVKFYEMHELSLSDYPGYSACSLYTAGSNTRCPFERKDLAFFKEGDQSLSEESVLDYLQKRKGLIDAVCIKGGEPLLHSGLADFLRKVKDLDYPIKLVTNGLNYNALNSIVKEGLVDFVSMHLYNSPERYAHTVNAENLDIKPIKKSVSLLLKGDVEYEFITTLCQEFHNEEEFTKMLKWIKGAKRYRLKNYADSDNIIQSNLTPFEDKDLERFKEMAEEYVKEVILFEER